MEHASNFDWFWKALTIIVACVGAAVTINQYRISKAKLRLDLFEKRHAVFRSARDFIAVICQEGRVPLGAQAELLRNTADAEFLFGPEVSEYLDLLYRQASSLHCHHVSIDPARAEDRRKHVDAESALVLWFAEQFKGNLRSKFAPYLAFRTWTT